MSLLWILHRLVNIPWCSLTTACSRARMCMWALWACSAAAGSCYAVSLYYIPVYFAFAKGADALQQTLCMLPFILSFIASVAITGRLLPTLGKLRATMAIYAAGGAIVVVAAGVLAATLQRETATSQVMGCMGLMGIGIGLLFQHSVSICNVMKRSEDTLARLDSLFMCNFAQMGGIAMTLAMAGCVFQNLGYRLLAEVSEGALTADQIRHLLAGNSIKSNNHALLQKGADVASEVIAKEFYVVIAAGSLCFIAGLIFTIIMRHHNIDFVATSVTNTSVDEMET